MRRILVREHERGLRFRHGSFVGVLAPGRYRLWSRLWSRSRDRVEVVSLLRGRFEHELLDVLVRHEALRSLVEVVDLGSGERALVWRAGRLEAVLGPGRHAFWREPDAVRVETFGATAEPFEHERIEAVVRHPDASDKLQVIEVDPRAEGLLYVNGRLARTLGPGRYLFWKGAGTIRVRVVDLRERTHEVAGQEIMTRDKVTLRLTLIVAFRVVDAERAVGVVDGFDQALYRKAQLALRTYVGTRSLDELLADKTEAGEEVRATLASRAGEYGVDVRSVGLRDIILPGDMKTILNRVIEAEKQAQAELIRRREETASARSQANTARLLDASPTLARMRELELLAEVLRGTKATFVFGSGDLADQVRSLATQRE